MTLVLTSLAPMSKEYEGFPKWAARTAQSTLSVMDCLLKTMPQDDPVYCFMDKKRAEGKPYLVYMTAGANKFLRTSTMGG